MKSCRPYSLSLEHPQSRLLVWQWNFVPKKFRGIDSERLLLFRGGECSFRGIPRFTEENSEARNGMELQEKNVFCNKSCSRKPNWERAFVREMLRNGIPRVCLYFCSTEWNSELFSLPRNDWNGIPNVCIYFCLTERNSELFSLPRNGLELNSERLLVFFVSQNRIPSIFRLCGMVRNGIPRVLCSTEQPEFRRNKLIIRSIPSSAE
jgi:hypothetical protein